VHTIGHDAVGPGSGFICNICAGREWLIVALRNMVFLTGYIVIICLFLRYYGKIDFNFYRLNEAYIVLSISLVLLQYRLKSFSAYFVLVLQPIMSIVLYISLYFPVMQYWSFFFCLFIGGGWLIAGGFLVVAKLGISNEFDEDEISEHYGRELAFRQRYAEIIRSEPKLSYFNDLECWSSKEYHRRFKP